MNGPLGKPEHLGDGLYVSHDDWGMIALTADLGSAIERTVYLEPFVYAALVRWVEARSQS